MPLVKLYFSPALLLLVLTCPLWQLSQSVPVMSKGPVTDSCVSYARTLLHTLQNITDTNAQNDLFSGIDCEKQSVELNMETNTMSVCAPKESACSGIVKAEFDQEACLTNIGEDLRYYYNYLSAQPVLHSLRGNLQDLMENCFTWSLHGNMVPKDMASEVAADRSNTFDERLSLCKVLKGFHIRTITINRAISYLNSGEHTK